MHATAGWHDVVVLVAHLGHPHYLYFLIFRARVSVGEGGGTITERSQHTSVEYIVRDAAPYNIIIYASANVHTYQTTKRGKSRVARARARVAHVCYILYYTQPVLQLPFGWMLGEAPAQARVQKYRSQCVDYTKKMCPQNGYVCVCMCVLRRCLQDLIIRDG